MRKLFLSLLAVGAIATNTCGAARAAASDASVLYVDAAGAVPTLHCRTPDRSTLGNCAIFLPPGEQLRSSAFITDMKRWALDNTSYGPTAGSEDAVVLIKERTDVAGITTLVYIPTTGRDGMYRAIVVSDPKAPIVSELHFMHVHKAAKPRVVALPKAKPQRKKVYAQTYAAARAAAQHARDVAAAQQQRELQAQHKAQMSALVAEVMNSPCKTRVDANYSTPVGDAPFRPVDVYNDGTHTCIVLPANFDGFAIPYAGSDLTHFHWREAEHMLVIDSRPPMIVLRDGPQEVTISHK
jgi:type IV secretory pathway VirB9-like protein